MSETQTTASASGGKSLSALETAQTIRSDDRITGVFGGLIRNATVKALVAAGLPDTVLHSDDVQKQLDAALSDSNLNTFAIAASKSADLAQTHALQADGAKGAATASALDAASSAAQAGTILSGVQTLQGQFNATAQSAENTLAGVTQDANSAKVLLTTALQGDTPLTYKGYWNAASNTPSLSSGAGSEGDLYVVSHDGTTALDGTSQWSWGDGAWFRNGAWRYFPRAGFAAVAQELTALQSIQAGQVRMNSAGGGDIAVAWVDQIARKIAAIHSDGSPMFYGDTARVANRVLTTTDLAHDGELRVGSDWGVLENTTTLSFPGRMTARPTLASVSDHRAPSAQDDLLAGYNPKDLWRTNDTLYECLDPTENGAIWSRDSSAAPVWHDVLLGSSLSGVWGLERMVSTYTGPLIAVMSIVNGTPTGPVVIGQNSLGALDLMALGTVRAQKDSGTRIAVVTWMDQSGNGHDLVADFATAPHIGETTVQGQPAISWDATGSSIPMRLHNDQIVFPKDGWGLLTYGRYTGTNTALGENTSLATLGSGLTNRVSIMTGPGENGLLCAYCGAGGYQSTTRPLMSSPSLFGVVGQGNAVAFLQGTDQSAAPVVASSLTSDLKGLSLGCMKVGDGDGGNASHLVLTGAVALNGISAPLLPIIKSAMLSYGYTPQAPVELHCIGDSRTAGYLNPDGINWPSIMTEEGYLKSPVRLFNWAVSGSTTVDFIKATQTSVVQAIQRATRPVLCTIWLGINDFGKIGYDLNAVTGRIQSIIDAILTAGARHVFVMPEFDPQSAGFFADRFRNIPKVTLINPFRPDLPMNNTSDPTLYHPDAVHPLPNGDRAIATLMAQAINTYLETSS